MHHAVNEYQLRLDVQRFLWSVYYLFMWVLYFAPWGVICFIFLTVTAVEAIEECNIRMIKGKFSNLVTKSRKRLQSKEVNVEDVQTFIIIMYLASNSKDGSDMVITVLEYAESLGEIFRALTKYGLWDYLNYYLLQSIIEEFLSDDDELKDMMLQYQQDLTGYVLTLKIRTYLEATYNKHSIATSESGNLESILPQQKHELFERLSIIVDTNITEASLHYVYNLWQLLSLQFELPQLPMILYDIAQVCCMGISMLIRVCVNMEVGPVVIIH